jgi:ADP-heptose:LPS heptosyltransferase
MLGEGLKSLNRTLAIRLDNIGDIVLLSPALRALRQAFPGSQITLMASPAGSQVSPLLPWIDDVLTWQAVWQDTSGEFALDPVREIELVNILQDRDYDAAFIFTSFSQSPYPPAYACYLAGIPYRIGHSREFGGRLLSHWSKPPAEAGHQADRNLALLKSVGLAVGSPQLELVIPERFEAEVVDLLDLSGIDPSGPFIVVAPGASCDARRYELARFAQVVDLLEERLNFPIIIVGSEREKDKLLPYFTDIRNGNSNRNAVFSLVGKTSLPLLAAIIRRSRLVIANNSASLHIADSFGVPMVILYSGTEHESQWMPRFAPARLLRRYTDCSPCYKFRCPFNMECLDIQPDEVFQSVADLLAATEDNFWKMPKMMSLKRRTAFER